MSFDKWIGTPALVLAVPGPAGGTVGPGMVDLVRAHRPEVEVRYGHTEGERETLTEALGGLRAEEGRALRAVVVPLLTAPYPEVTDAVDAAVRAAGADARVTDVLGPHPMLAEALHQRLAVDGLVRADRMRRISVTAASATMADGVIVGAVGGAEAVSGAGVSAVLLAARLGVTVLPADLGDDAGLKGVLAQLSEAGSVRPVVAPSVIAAEFGPRSLARLSERHRIRVGSPLGAEPLLGKIVAWRYAEVLNALGAERQPSLEELPAPVGSRHRPES
ncbi:sirohydrochlorin chelatase [Murinocardiopsis flavida]|uniref:sirohydrochlorin chelatase n=1 Tax=Murinocardiopsis flavida TaxID=645275 RepID=UPI000D0E0217